MRVCTSPDQCGAGESCVRYRCVAPTRNRAEAGSPTAAPEPSAVVPPAPDATAGELRAIRRELELLREGQQRILDELGKKAGGDVAR